MVLNLLRGAGPDGMAARLEHGARRPLLALRRTETRALCAAAGLDPVDDPSNADPRFLRNRVRAEVLPLLDDVAGRDVAALLVRQARAFADDADLLDELAGALDVTDASALASAHPALARRAVRTWLRTSGGGLPPDAASVDRVLAVARGDAVAAEVAGGRRVARTGGTLRIEPSA
jgi:tRNA(Ile)-lysidine synthase